MSNQLFFLSLADIFSIYPQIFREIISQDEAKRKLVGKLPTDHIYLPSDADWQEHVYYRLLDVQKKVNEALATGLTLEEITKKTERPVFDSSFVVQKFSPSTTPNGRSDDRKRCAPDQPIEFIDSNVFGCWTLQNISKAAKLLRNPPISVEFCDEHEMRRVYSLIYDVFRYKVVMSNALTDVSFYAHYPQLAGHENRVWLMLFELFTRHFLKRKSEQIQLQDTLYEEAGVREISDCLWKHRIRLAASISRMRIQNGALELSQLLPTHLQNEKVAIAAANPIVTGWVNPFLLENKTIAETYLSNLGLTEVSQGDNKTEQPLQENQFKWDKICPLFLSLLPHDRSEFARSDLIRQHFFIMQDRTFALAPAITSQLLAHYELEGDIIQTHVSSPRSTAYLACLFRSINRVFEFHAYGCGSMLDTYNAYMKSLGIRNVRLFAEPFVSIPLEDQRLVACVGILATPPNSFSAVADPIDLICSRGGDLKMLQVMTECEIGDDGRNRVGEILREQRETLRLAMSRPQVQFVLYQTHSVVDCENEEMIELAVATVNRNAFEKHLAHFKERKRLEELAEAELAGVPAAANLLSPRKRTAASAATTKSEESSQTRIMIGSRESSFIGEETPLEEEDYTQYIRVPRTDEFEIANIPDLCLNQDKCLKLNSMGCYIALVQRKQITRLNAKFLIKMAEARGLFGKADPERLAKLKAIRKQEKLEAKKAAAAVAKPQKNRKDQHEKVMQRLLQPTKSSSIRAELRRMTSVESKYLQFGGAKRQCHRNLKLTEKSSFSSPNDPRARRWWQDSVKYVQALQKRFKKRSQPKEDLTNIKKLVKFASYPLYLPCRDRYLSPKEPYPVTMNYLNFKEHKRTFPNVLSLPQLPGLRRSDFNPFLSSRQRSRPLGFYSHKQGEL